MLPKWIPSQITPGVDGSPVMSLPEQRDIQVNTSMEHHKEGRERLVKVSERKRVETSVDSIRIL